MINAVKNTISILVLSFIFSCQNGGSESNLTEKVESNSTKSLTFKKIEDDSNLQLDRYTNNYTPIKFIQKKLIQIGDSIKVFGGEKQFLQDTFGCSSCDGIVTEILFSIETGQLAFIDFNENLQKEDLYSISICYLDSKRGYQEANLYIWERMPTALEIKEVPEYMSFEAKHIKIDQNLGFNRILRK